MNANADCALFHLPACQEFLAREFAKVVSDRPHGKKSYLPQVL